MCEFDVAIVGFGPVGGLAALSLADAGLRVLLLERSHEAAQLPRAVALDGETLRAFQRLGLADEIFACCQPPRVPNQIGFANSRFETLFGVDVPPSGPNGWCDILFFDQPELEVLLREIVARDDRIDVRLGHDLVSIEQDADAVTLTSVVTDASTEVEHRARYVIGCDGASSFVRQAIGTGWESLDYDQDWLVVDVIQGPNANLPLETMQICDPARLATYVCVKDPNRRWEFQLREGETREEMLAPEKIRALLDPWTEPENYEIRRAAVYQFHAAIADTWRVGRILLAGDAAHQTPPFLGQGLNAGFRDALNLGWKLPLVLSRACDERLLDTYATERDPHARELVDRAVGIGKLMETLAAREAGLPDPHRPESINVDPGGPLVPPMRSGILTEGRVNEEGAGRGPRNSRVGELLRQPTVRDCEGIEKRLDDFLGPGFSIVARERKDLELGADANAALQRLDARTLALEDFEVVEGAWDPLFHEHPAAVVRPDRYVFGVVDDDSSLDRLVASLCSKLCLVEGSTHLDGERP